MVYCADVGARGGRVFLSWLASGALLTLGACGGGGGAPSATASGAATAAVTASAPVAGGAAAAGAAGSGPALSTGQALYAEALEVWRAPRPKDACMSCHGPDFIDLARIGSTDADVVRRAIIDGASEAEAQLLLRAVKEMRAAWRMPAADARTFRLLQPGGAVLPGATSAERDLALAGELARALPTLMSETPIRSRAQALQARDEVLAFDWSRVRVGVAFPLWSADIAHGPAEGTLNDWIADEARVPRAERRVEWIALQDAYLADPSHLNFWRLYFAVDEMTEPFRGTATPFDPTDGWKMRRLAEMKFKSALIGQHVMRAELQGRLGSFLRGQTAFSYLIDESPYRELAAGKVATNGGTNYRVPTYLPNPWWEVGDSARIGFSASALSAGRPGNNGGQALMRDTLGLLGAPDFVVESVDAGRLRNDEETEVRLSWFMAGMLLDPALQRTHPSNSTKSAEYLLGNLWQRDYFLHRSLVSTLRTVVRRYGPLATPERNPGFTMNLSYFAAYGRSTPTRWNMRENQALPTDVRDAQLRAFRQFTANMYRMNLYLHAMDLESGRIAPYGTSAPENQYASVLTFFRYAQLPGLAEDEALVAQVAALSGTIL